MGLTLMYNEVRITCGEKSNKVEQKMKGEKKSSCVLEAGTGAECYTIDCGCPT